VCVCVCVCVCVALNTTITSLDGKLTGQLADSGSAGKLTHT